MGSFGSWMDVTITAGNEKSAETDLGNEYDYLILLLPSISGKLWLEVAEKTTAQGGTYYKLGKDVTTEADGFNRADVWRLGGFKHIKIVSSEASSSNRTIRVRGWRT